MQTNASSGKVYGIGLGTGSKRDITLHASEILSCVDKVYTHVLSEKAKKIDIIAKFVDREKIVPFITPSRNEWVKFISKMKDLASAMENDLENGYSVAYVSLGDIGFCSYFSYLDYYLSEKEIVKEYVPGLSYYNGITSAISDVVAEEGDRLSVLRCPQNIYELDKYLEVSDSIVLFTVNNLSELENYCKERKIPYARVASCIGQENMNYMDLKNYKPGDSVDPFIVILKTYRKGELSRGGRELNSSLLNIVNIEPVREVYKKLETGDLELNIFDTKQHIDGNGKPVILLFHGGGWKNGSPDALKGQCKYLASKNLVAISAEYRIKSKHSAINARHCIEDARDAVLWIYENGEALGIDKNKIIIGGGSSGGHIAACTVILEDNKMMDVGKIPQALILLNPVTDLTENGFRNEAVEGECIDISPLYHIRESLPPTLICHGTDDKIVPFKNSVDFTNKMIEKGNTCLLFPYDGRGHAFFNHGRSEFDVCYYDTLDKIESFLREIGFIP